MKSLRTRSLAKAVIAAAIAATAIGGAAVAQASRDTGNGGDHRTADTTVADAFTAVDRNTAWQLTSRLKLDFPTFHTEGIAFSEDHIFLSSVEILEPTVKFPSPQGGYDRTAGKGKGHLFVMDKAGKLQKDIVLGEGDMYHPGGIDFDGTNVWVAVAQYRPNSSSIVYRVDAKSLDVRKQFEVKDHFGGIVMDKQSGHLIGNTWGSRRFAEWTLKGKELSSWQNPDNFIDYQDCQYAADSKMLCAGVASLPQMPAAGGPAAKYDLGGIALIDSRTHATLHSVPFQQWSADGHVASRNPFKMTAAGNHLTMRVAPDNAGMATEILTYEATVTPAR
ncbi:DUF6454 family protein [Burkholderia sp. RS01]|uniref:DUF6454 family protein n=1 Tax=unclassified Burkholderia TaxID=2613784 RepID=UPI0032184DE8